MKEILMKYTVVHKHCGMKKVITGYDLWSALKENGLDFNLWEAYEIEFAEKK